MKTDALSVVVSEETGQIPIANNGRMVRNLEASRHRPLAKLLVQIKKKRTTPA